MKDLSGKVAVITGAGDGVGSALASQLAQRIGVSAEHVAQRIIKAIQKNQLRIRVGKDAVLLDILKRWFPVGIQKLLGRIV